VKLPPVWEDKSPTPVKAKTSAPAAVFPTSCAALTRRGLLSSTHTGSRERGGGLRQTLEQARARGHVRQRGNAGTAWATPLEHTPPALTKTLVALRAAKGVRRVGVVLTQAACGRGACARLAASKVAV
jgi:hypothetical protein